VHNQQLSEVYYPSKTFISPGLQWKSREHNAPSPFVNRTLAPNLRFPLCKPRRDYVQLAWLLGPMLSLSSLALCFTIGIAFQNGKARRMPCPLRSIITLASLSDDIPCILDVNKSPSRFYQRMTAPCFFSAP